MAGVARGWFKRALNNEPALMFSAIIGFGVLVVPMIGQLSGNVKTEVDDDCHMAHRYEERSIKPVFDADTFMRYYKSKNAYRSYGPPENSGVEREELDRHEWLMRTGYAVNKPQPWVLPDLGYTQARPEQKNEGDEAAAESELEARV